MAGRVSLENIQPGEIPVEILDQLRVLNRIQFPLKPTSTSAISSSASDPESPVVEKDPEFDQDRLIDSVGEMEDLVEQLEDAADQLLKDMEIPFPNKSIEDAVKRLDPEANAITKPVLDKALAMMDYFPLMALGQDPVLGALTGDGTIEGPYLNCNEMTQALGDIITVPPKDEVDAEAIVGDMSVEVLDKWEEKQQNMLLEIILKLWWNIIWAKFLVDMAIIKPTKMIVADPTDALIGFFMKRRFRRKGKQWIDENGPLNKVLKKIRKFLICVIPPKVYARYDPMVDDLDCGDAIDQDCSANNIEEGDETSIKNEQGSIRQIGDMIENAMSGAGCINSDDFIGDYKEDLPEGLGISPECVDAAKKVLDAVLADALTPGKTTIHTATARYLSQLQKDQAI